MTDHLGSTYFRPLFDSALQDYEQKTNIKLAEHPLAEQLEKCHSFLDINALLHEQAQNFRENDKVLKSIDHTVKALHHLSDVLDSVGLVRQMSRWACSMSLMLIL
jgi:hypothetical protein